MTKRIESSGSRRLNKQWGLSETESPGMVRSYLHLSAHTKSSSDRLIVCVDHFLQGPSVVTPFPWWWIFDEFLVFIFLDRISTHLYASIVAIHSDKHRVIPFLLPGISQISSCQWVAPDKWGSLIVYSNAELSTILKMESKVACKMESLSVRHKLKKTSFPQFGLTQSQGQPDFNKNRE